MNDLATPSSPPLSSTTQSDPVPLAEIMVGQFPGWFPDPTSPTSERFWNGANWTERLRIAIPSSDANGAENYDRPLRLEDFLQPVEPIILAILSAP